MGDTNKLRNYKKMTIMKAYEKNFANSNYVFATFLDAAYLPKLFVTFTSLKRHLPNVVLFAYCFDDISFDVISKLNRKSLIPVHYHDFEVADLLKTKHLKSKYYEYYWSYKPEIVLQTMKRTDADIVTYIDCDFLFFSSPKTIFTELGTGDVLIQPNNFSFEESKQIIPVGYYCSCFETFRNNSNGKKVLCWWRERCIEWCLAIFDRNRFADQKYLDDWRKRFANVVEVSNVGANVAPWNVQKYHVNQKGNKLFVNTSPIIYYHYHSFRMNTESYEYIITGDRDNSYEIDKDVIKALYQPYIKELRKAIILLKKNDLYSSYSRENPESKVRLIKADAQFSSYRNSI